MEQKKPEEKSVLVTVGSTQFEDLIEAVDTVEFGELLVEKGYTKLLIQFGPLGKYEPHLLEECCRTNQEFKNKKFTVEAFRMNPEFGKIMKSASLVISHDGKIRAKLTITNHNHVTQRIWDNLRRVKIIVADDCCGK